MLYRVLVLLTSSNVGGAERLVLDQARYYDREVFDLHVLTLREGGLEKDFLSSGVKYHCLNSKGRVNLRTFWRILTYIKKNRIDLVHTHLIEASLYGFLCKLFSPGLSLVCTKHAPNQFRKKAFWRLANKFLSCGFDKILAVSESVKNFLIKYEYISPQRIQVVPNGVDVRRFRKVEELSALRKELGVDKRNFIIGIVGRLVDVKRHEYLFEAVARLKVKVPVLKLLVVGSGELRGSLERLARKLGIEKEVLFLGFRRDMARLYSLMDVLCLVSKYEGFGLVLVEAMLCETLTVGVGIPAIREIIEDKESGFIVPRHDSEKVADLLCRIYQGNFDPAIIQRAKQRVLEKYDVRANLRQVERVYERVLERRCFIKRISDRDLLCGEVDKLARLWAIARARKIFAVPRVLGINPREGYFCLRRIRNAVELRDFLFRNNNVFFSNVEKLERLYFKLGRIIGCIHDNLTLDKEDYLEIQGYSPDDYCFLHGDLGLSNILVRDDEVWILDPSVSKFQRKVCLFGPFYYDLAQLIIYTRAILPLASLSFYQFRNVEYFEKSLLAGYERERGVKVEPEKLKKMKESFFETYLTAKRRGDIRRFFYGRLLRDEW